MPPSASPSAGADQGRAQHQAEGENVLGVVDAERVNRRHKEVVKQQHRHQRRPTYGPCPQRSADSTTASKNNMTTLAGSNTLSSSSATPVAAKQASVAPI